MLTGESRHRIPNHILPLISERNNLSKRKQGLESGLLLESSIFITLTGPSEAGTLLRDEDPKTPLKKRRIRTVWMFLASATPKASPKQRKFEKQSACKAEKATISLADSPAKQMYVPMYTGRNPIRCANGPKIKGPSAKPNLQGC